MVLAQQDQLLAQGLNVPLELQPRHVGVIQDLAQPRDVAVH